MGSSGSIREEFQECQELEFTAGGWNFGWKNRQIVNSRGEKKQQREEFLTPGIKGVLGVGLGFSQPQSTWSTEISQPSPPSSLNSQKPGNSPIFFWCKIHFSHYFLQPHNPHTFQRRNVLSQREICVFNSLFFWAVLILKFLKHGARKQLKPQSSQQGLKTPPFYLFIAIVLLLVPQSHPEGHSPVGELSSHMEK